MNTTTNNIEEREEQNWGAEPWRAPALDKGDTLLYSECGRIIKAATYGHSEHQGIDYRSHYFRVVNGEYGGCFLLVKHGGGQERIKLDYAKSRVAQFFEPLDSTQRYMLMHTFFTVHREAETSSRNETASRYTSAFVDGRLKKRNLPARGIVKVWIENAKAA